MALGFKRWGQIVFMQDKWRKHNATLPDLPVRRVTAEQNDFFFHYEWCGGGGGGERRCFAAPRLRRVWERFACLSRRYFDLTWLLHATFLTGIVNSRGITSSGKINSWLTNHYFLTHPHYFPVNSKALIKPSERVNATKARDLFYTRHLFCNLPI